MHYVLPVDLLCFISLNFVVIPENSILYKFSPIVTAGSFQCAHFVFLKNLQ